MNEEKGRKDQIKENGGKKGTNEEKVWLVFVSWLINLRAKSILIK